MMKDYKHMMEQVTLRNEKKEEIMELLDNGSEQKRRHVPKAARIALAAALVLVCMMSIAAAADLPLLPSRVYHFFSGGSLTAVPGKDVGLIGTEAIDGGGITLTSPENDPLVLEDGRLWFVNGKERTDVTDLIDEDTPYIYEHTDPTSGIKGYLILGGTPDDFGWAEYTDMGSVGSGYTGNNFSHAYATLDGERIRGQDLTPEQLERTDRITEIVYESWFVAAMNQLGIEKY